ncbi:diguanylate cyclase domain-containing protein [Rhodococcus sp. NPDC078407]|uniref:sensor domain-containing diguanylate cyclase n=1 Tax=Rhodococcus sp. NPDC078407 TaxID=3364509 RepID=UPI0037C790E3
MRGEATRKSSVPGFEMEELAEIANIVAQFPIATVVHSVDSVIISANFDCCDLLGYDIEDLPGRSVVDFIPDTERKSAQDLARVILSAPVDAAGRTQPVRALRQLRRRDGTVASCWMHMGCGVLRGRRVVVVCIDLINPVVHDAHKWRSLAERDDLTGLYRRGPFQDVLEGWISSEMSVTLAFVDVDDLKTVNDAHGHHAGDALLEAVATRLASRITRDAIVGRFAGDEFVLAVPERRDPDKFAAQLQTTVCRVPVRWRSERLTVSVSVGVAIHRPGETVADLVKRADEQMYATRGLSMDSALDASCVATSEGRDSEDQLVTGGRLLEG